MTLTLVNGVELFHDEVGSGEVVIFHPGQGSTRHPWIEGIAPRLADGYRCICLDARGVGDSVRPGWGYEIDQYARDVLGLADALGIERFTFVGHSMGGGVGMQLALDAPERLERLVLVASIPSGGTAQGEEWAEEAWQARERAQRAAPDARERLLRDRRLIQVRDISDEELLQAIDRVLAVDDGHLWSKSIARFNVTDRLHEIETPTLVVGAATDHFLQGNVADCFRLPNAALHVFSRTGHNVMRDVPEELAAVLLDFFEHGAINARTLAERFEAHSGLKVP